MARAGGGAGARVQPLPPRARRDPRGAPRTQASDARPRADRGGRGEQVRTGAFLVAMSLCACAAGSPDPPPAAPPKPAAGDAEPFRWMEWRPETFAYAKSQKRLILVDVVAEWCHW